VRYKFASDDYTTVTMSSDPSFRSDLDTGQGNHNDYFEQGRGYKERLKFRPNIFEPTYNLCHRCKTTDQIKSHFV